MKAIAVNGSPRRNGNTVTLLNHALEGAKSQGFDTEIINLYTLHYKGCASCFYCKRKDKQHGTCALKDDLSPVLEKLAHADMLIFGSPIYYDNISSGMAAFLERFLFSNFLYSFEISTVFSKVMPTGFIYSMNSTKPQMQSVHIPLISLPRVPNLPCSRWFSDVFSEKSNPRGP